MASKTFLVAMVIVVAVVAPVMAKDFLVGDDIGWALNFDYNAWAAGKEFHVGDRLVFVYTAGSHNVIKSNQTEFQQCLKSVTSPPLTTGNDSILLATPGKKWYICGVADHCVLGMKLAVNVLPDVGSPAPSPCPAGSAAIRVAPSE